MEDFPHGAFRQKGVKTDLVERPADNPSGDLLRPKNSTQPSVLEQAEGHLRNTRPK